MNHVMMGFRILEGWRKTLQDGDATFAESKFVRENLAPIFSRLGIISELFGKPLPYLTHNDEYMDLPADEIDFQSVNDARDVLATLMNKALRFIRVNGEKRYSNSIGIEELLEHNQLVSRFGKWKKAFEDCVQRSPSHATQSERRGINLVRVHYLVSYIWLYTCLSPSEMAFDDCIPQFEQLIDFSEDLVSDPLAIPGNSPPKFSFEMGVVAPLYFVAIKCRAPSTRRRAMGLLAKYPRREGLVDSNRALKIAQRVIELEEAKVGVANVDARFLADSSRDRPNMWSANDATCSGQQPSHPGGDRTCEVPHDLDRRGTRSRDQSDAFDFDPPGSSDLPDAMPLGAIPTDGSRIYDIDEIPTAFNRVFRVEDPELPQNLTRVGGAGPKIDQKAISDGHRNRAPVTFRLRPDGPRGDWKVLQEFIVL